jgi:hypothetical protein
MASKAGGGIRSKNVTQRPVRYGDRAREMHPKGVSQIGTQRSNHSTNSSKILRKDVEPVRGEQRPRGGPGGIALGNEVARNVGKGGPGAGRMVHATGSQSQHGPVAAMPAAQGRDILSEFGRESPNAMDRGRR